MPDLRDKNSCSTSTHANYQPVKPAVIAKKLGLVGTRPSAKSRRSIKRLVKEEQIAYGPEPSGVRRRQEPCPESGREEAAEKAAAKLLSSRTHESSGEIMIAHQPRNSIAKEPIKKLKPCASRLERQRAIAEPRHRHLSPRGGRLRLRPARRARCGPMAATPTSSSRWTRPATPPAATSSRCGSNKRGRMGKLEGRIIDVLERATNRFVGVYFEQAGMGLVQIDGKLFPKPIYVGDPGAKGARPDDKVVIEMVRFPSHIARRRGRDRRSARPARRAGRRHDVDHPRVQSAGRVRRRRARRCPQAGRRSSTNRSPKGRRDLTDETIITIDPVDARDFDDAISLEKIEERPLAAGRAHRRRLALRPAEDAARPRGPRPGHERVSARSRDSRCCRRSSRTISPACSRTRSATRSRR